MAEASLVSSRNQDPPLLWGSAGGFDASSNGLFPIIESQDVESLPAGFGSCLMRIDGAMRLVGAGDVGDVRGNFIEIILRLGFYLIERAFLLGGSR